MRGRRSDFWRFGAVVVLAAVIAAGAACKKEDKRSARGKRDRQGQSQRLKDAKRPGADRRGSKRAEAKPDRGERASGQKPGAGRREAKHGRGQRGQSKASNPRKQSRLRSSSKRVSPYPRLESIRLEVPPGWRPYYVKDRSAGLRASYRLAALPADSEDVLVYLEHAPTIRGREPAMLAGWFGQALALNSAVQSPESMNVRPDSMGAVSITLAEMEGAPRRVGQPTTDEAVARHTVLIAILEHADGPHVIRAWGPSASVRRWHESIMSYIRSVRPAT